MFDFQSLLKLKNKAPVSIAEAEAILEKARQLVASSERKERECRNVLNESIVDCQLSGQDVPAKIRDALSKAQADLVFANASKEAAQAILAVAQDADIAAHRQAQIEQVAQHMANRDKDGAALADAIGNVVAIYKSMLLNAQNAEAVGLPLPMGSMTGAGSLERAVEFELYRQGHDTEHKMSFPGGKSPAIQLSGQPLAINPLADELKQATAFTISTLKAGRD
jgi:hypothetical protein